MSQNPFIVGRPVPDDGFVGRLTEIDAAFDQILNRGNLAIWGSPGIGKSSFLEKLASPQEWKLRGHDPLKAVIIRQSCLSVSPFSAMGFWREVLLQLQDAFDNEPELQARVNAILEKEKTTSNDLRQVLKKLGKQSKVLLLLVDDYNVAMREHQDYTEGDINAFLSECRVLVAHCPESRYLSMVVTSIRRLNEIGSKLKLENGSPWYNHYLFLPLKPFSSSEIDTLLSGMPMTLSLKEAIREIAGGNPALVQNAGHLLYRELHAGRVPDSAAFIRDFQSATEHFFEDTWNFASPVEQTLMMLIALSELSGRLHKKRYDLSDIEIIFSQKELELKGLEEQGIILHKIQNGRQIYTFASSMMQWWVVKKIENSDEAWLRQQEKPSCT